MPEKLIFLNPRSAEGGGIRCDAIVPMRALVPGQTIPIEIKGEEDGRAERKQCTVRQVHWRHRWLRVSYPAGGAEITECFKMVPSDGIWDDVLQGNK